MLYRLKESVRRFMAGRYGTDALNQTLNLTVLVLLILNMVFKVQLFFVLALGLWAWELFRTFSRNIPARTAENYRFYLQKEKLTSMWRNRRTVVQNHKQYHYYRCPQCRQKLRVPRGRGRIQIRCPRCDTEFIKHS